MSYIEDIKIPEKSRPAPNFRIQGAATDLFETILSDFQKDPTYEVEIINRDEIIIKKRNK